MSDLISRKAAISLAKDVCVPTGDGSIWRHRCIDPDKIRELPSAEPEIIRCKNCKWCVEHYDTDGNAPYWICKNWNGGTDADGFCHEAERRIDE